jgi:predicted enzyme related to lactoylglutathione lyase
MINNAGISGGLAPRQNPEQMPTMFVAVESIDVYIGKAQELGAKVMKNKQEIDAGWLLCSNGRSAEKHFWDVAG